MKIALTVLAGVAIIASTANARLGESFEVCNKRYGEPIRTKLDDTNTGVAIYDKNDLTIKIHFNKGSADLIRYSPGEVGRVDLETAQRLLKLNGRDKEWKQLTDTTREIWDTQDLNAEKPRIEMVEPILWKTKDEVLEASYWDSIHTLEIKASTIQLQTMKGL